MANVSIQYACGCGYARSALEAAEKHCDTSGHTMTVSGQIRPTERRTRIKGTSAWTRRTRAFIQAPTPEPAKADHVAEFNALRAKLRKRAE